MANQAVYTYGWDTAFGIPVPLANKAIVDKKSSPTQLQYADSQNIFTLSGVFGDWQICEGGSGTNVRFSLPLSKIVLTYKSTGNVVTCPSGTAVMEVNMHYVPHQDTEPTTVKSNPVALKVNPIGVSESQPAAVLVSLVLSESLGTFTTALIQEGLKEWLNDNLDTFNHIFSVVDLNRMIDQGQWGFVTPNYTSYAFLDGRSLNDSLLGILTMTGKRTGDGLANQISNNIIPSGSKAGFIVSQERTLLDLIKPAIMQAYTGLTNDNFLLNNQATMLYLKNGVAVNLSPITHNGSTYHPVLTQLSVESVGEIITLQSETSTEIVAGITAKCTTTNWYKIVLGNSQNGQTLQFVEAQPADVQHTIEQSEGSIITEIVISVAATIALIILTIVTGGTALIVGGLIIGLIAGAAMIVPDVIKMVNTDRSPSIDLMLLNAVAPIRWTDSKDFELDYASMNVSLQLGGNPSFI